MSLENPLLPSELAPREARYRESTVAAIVFGLVVGSIMNASIAYAGLKIGFTIGGSAIAAVLGFGVLRGLLRRGTILETNIGQTVASAVNIPNSGIIFTVPVLLLLDPAQKKYPLRADDSLFWMMTLACVAGAVLGCAFIIPVRKQMIDIDRLRFPTGTAVAAILKSPGAGVTKTFVLLAGVAVAMLVFLPVMLPAIKIGPRPVAGAEDRREPLWGYGDLHWRMPTPRLANPNDPSDVQRERQAWARVDRDGDRRPDLILTHETIDVGRLFHFPDQVLFVFAITPLSLGAGYVTGRAGLLVLAGGILAYFVLNPFVFAMGWTPESITAAAVPEYAHGAFNRPLGIGMLLGGALMGLVVSLPSIREALKSLMAARRDNASGGSELGLRVLLLAGGAAVAGLFVAADAFVGSDGGWLGGLNPHLRSLIVALVGAVWIWFGGIIIAQCTGMTDWSPISGMALLTVVLVMLLVGVQEVAGAVLIGAAMCVAISCAADMMQDLKTGHLVGAQPKRQQIVELACTGLGPVITMATLLLIVAANVQSVGTPIGPGTPTPAPQADALKTVVEGVQGGEIPYALYGCGAVLGVLLGLGSFAGLGVLVGLSMYLPFEYVLTYGVGCLIHMGVSAVKGKTWAEEWGVPFCAGLIVGEAVLSLIINAVVLGYG
ncbi:MAG: OPT/YSL family transporter [Pirellulales bacterium]|nr:OPT/YSL family transporter [Pirellulales bacterium]